MQRFASSAASAALAAAFAAVAFAAKGGNDLSDTTIVEVTLIVAGGIAAAAGVAYGRTGRHGRGTLLVFGLFAVITTVSIVWSIAPDLSWIEANRTLAYFAVFAAGVAAGRLAPGGYAVVLRGLLGGAVIITGYALVSRVWPETLGGSTEIYARIGQPFEYWNAVGVTAALAVPAALWLGARRSGHQPANALAYPAMAIFLVAMFLSYSRGAMGVALAAIIVWFAFVPLRLRSLPVLVLPAAGATPVILWALSRDEFTKDGLSPAQRAIVGPEFGLLLLAMCTILLAAGLLVGFRGRGWAPSFQMRRRTGVAAVAIAAAIPLLVLTSVAFSDRGLPGTVSDRLDELTSETAQTPGGPKRLIRASSTRGRYWRQAGHIFGDQPLTGTGAGTFGISRLHWRKDQLVVRHAHGFVAQTAADLGVLGLLAILALAGAWFVSAARTTGLERHPERREGAPNAWDADRVAMVAIALSAIAFGIHSGIDWTWSVPGPAVMGIAAAGFVAGRGPAPKPDDEPPPMVVGKAAPWPPRVRMIPAVGALIVAIVAAWAAFQPQRAENETRHALDLLGRHQLTAADNSAKKAHEINPLSVRPLFARASIAYTSGKKDAARTYLQEAVFEQPSNPETWTRLAEFELYRMKDANEALRVVAGAIYLDPLSRPAQTVFFDARRAARGDTL